MSDERQGRDWDGEDWQELDDPDEVDELDLELEDEMDDSFSGPMDEEDFSPVRRRFEDDEEENFDSLADSPVGFVIMDTDADDGPYPLDADEVDEFISVGTNPEGVMDVIEAFTDDEDIRTDFSERQEYNLGSDGMLETLSKHHSKKPELSGGDLDAAWQDSDQSGEESVGGTVSTPDQDVVDELGEAVGIIYSDDEPLNTYDKLKERDDHRWELDPASSDDLEEPDDEEDLEI